MVIVSVDFSGSNVPKEWWRTLILTPLRTDGEIPERRIQVELCCSVIETLPLSRGKVVG